ncbi:LOW QUALITY PROTEIN: hypothetical protein Cgig2_013214 [Carnegiea gigantea]|uniref:Uncharacterized protein n=1 Tax=Carnegiea gigantea TaxID=171969 RepID=A0A9Q1KQ95_9CARY|nr:LOW QUALITY PROTEIN: hypothetical protein Cgig2_013214 [Carnegiea gigantea]
MALAIGYCHPMTILVRIYMAFNEISRSSHPEGMGATFLSISSMHAKNLNTYKFSGKAFSSVGMVKFSGLGQAKSFQLEKAREVISFTKGFRWHSFIINGLKETLTDGDKLSKIGLFLFWEHSFEFYLLPLQPGHGALLPDPEKMLPYHHMLACRRVGSQVLLFMRYIPLETKPTHAFCEW